MNRVVHMFDYVIERDDIEQAGITLVVFNPTFVDGKALARSVSCSLGVWIEADDVPTTSPGQPKKFAVPASNIQ